MKRFAIITLSFLCISIISGTSLANDDEFFIDYDHEDPQEVLYIPELDLAPFPEDPPPPPPPEPAPEPGPIPNPVPIPGFDEDSDEIEDEWDNCPNVANHDQLDHDQDDIGDACDFDYVIEEGDDDGDGIDNDLDNCENVANEDQEDSDQDGIGNACDTNIQLSAPKRFEGFALEPTSCKLHTSTPQTNLKNQFIYFLWISLILLVVQVRSHKP